MFKVVALLVVALVAVNAHSSPLTEEEYQFLFTKWVAEHERTYEHDAFFTKFNTFKSNLNRIIKHNAGNSSYSVQMNQFGDMSQEEYKATMLGYNDAPRNFLRMQNTEELPTAKVGDAIDWVAKGAVTPVKNQGQCGSCWAFSTTGSMEGAHQIATGNLVSMSEQQLVDCAGAEGNQGCNGGLMDYGFEYVIKNGGICTEDSYSYKGTGGSCAASSCTKVSSFSLSGYKDVTQGSSTSLMSAIQNGPVSIAIEADQFGFQFYSGGVFTGSCGTKLDHGVLLVGFGTDGGKDYWKVKNSWGASWGEQGYIRMTRTGNECGLLNSASYPKV